MAPPLTVIIQKNRQLKDRESGDQPSGDIYSIYNMNEWKVYSGTSDKVQTIQRKLA